MSNHQHQKKYHITQWIRHGVQLAAFLLYPGLFISVFGALRSVIQSLVNLSFTWATEGSQVLILIAVFPITILWGRFFCGYLCSFGAMGDLMHFVGEKLHVPQVHVPKEADRILSKVKYVIFFLILVFFWILGFSVDSSLSPWTAFGALATLNFSQLLTVGSLLLLLIMVGSLFIERFFCRYLCPLGAVFSLVSMGRLFKIHREPSACVKCGKCDRECPVGIEVHRKRDVTSGECIDCMKCVDYCPTSCLYANPTPAVAGTAAALSIMGLVYVGRVASGSISGGTTSITASAESTEQGPYTDGTYTGSGEGYRGTTTVEVTVSGGYITDITVTSYADDDEFFNQAKSTIISEVLEAQSADVDTVSGATFSSNGLIDAIADALSNAGGETSVTADATTEDTESTEEASTTEETTEESTESTTTSATDIDLSTIADGTYTGSGTGLRGTTQVQVTVENGEITDITVLSYEDDQQYFEKAESTIISEILSAQSINVSTVSGATFSSNGIIEAVADALGVDWINPNSSASSGRGSAPQSSSESSSADTSTTSDSSTTTGSSDIDLSTIADGTYTGSGTGLRGTTEVQVTVENGQITDITVLSYEDDQQFFEKAQSTIISEILSSQSINVSTVSGATFSSNGIIEAVANALGVDWTNPNSTLSSSEGGHGGHGGF